jgi:hypothetical protein
MYESRASNFTRKGLFPEFLLAVKTTIKSGSGVKVAGSEGMRVAGTTLVRDGNRLAAGEIVSDGVSINSTGVIVKEAVSDTLVASAGVGVWDSGGKAG